MADRHRYTVSRVDAGDRYPQFVGVGVGKRRWYATIFSFDRPRSRSISTERHGRSPSPAGFSPRSASPWPLRPLVFTRASSVFIPAVPSMFHAGTALYMKTCVMFMVYYLSLTGMRRLAQLVSVSGACCRITSRCGIRWAAVPSALDHATMMYGDGRINEAGAQRHEVAPGCDPRPLASRLYPTTSVTRIAAIFRVSLMALRRRDRVSRFGSSGQSLWGASQRRERNVDHWLEHGRASMLR